MIILFRYKGVIFDLDGTLIDTIEDISDSVNEVLTIYGYPNHSYEDFKLKVGKGFKDLIKKSFPKDADEKIIENGVSLFVESYNKNYQNKTKPYEDVEEVLKELHKMGIKIGVNSNKRNDYTNQLITKCFNVIPFVAILGEREGIPKKPDPMSALEIAKLMNLNPSEILYIGDTKTDISTSKNAGMDSIGVLWGFRSFEELESHGATYIISNAMEILDIVKGGNYSE